jgi:hypothetical protein
MFRPGTRHNWMPLYSRVGVGGSYSRTETGRPAKMQLLDDGLDGNMVIAVVTQHKRIGASTTIKLRNGIIWLYRCRRVQNSLLFDRGSLVDGNLPSTAAHTMRWSAACFQAVCHTIGGVSTTYDRAIPVGILSPLLLAGSRIGLF